MFELMYHAYGNTESVGYKGSYSVDNECVGFLTLDDKFLSIAKVYGVELSDSTGQ